MKKVLVAGALALCGTNAWAQFADPKASRPNAEISPADSPATGSPAPTVVPAASEPAGLPVPKVAVERKQPPIIVAPALEPQPPEPLAGYTNGTFFVRDPHNWFVFFPKARLNVDGYVFLNRGDPPAGVDANSARDGRPKSTIFVRRARAEFQGTVVGHFDFHIAAEYASVPATGATGIVSDAYMIVDYLSYLKLQAGQFDAPFTLENRTSDKYIDFMERSMVVRNFGVPSNKDQGAMVFGWLPKRFAYYSIGVFNGDGQSFRDQDGHPAIIGRAFIAPFALMARKYRWLEDFWIGASAWWKRSENDGGPVAPNAGGAAQNDLAAMTTQGGWNFFQTNYANGTDANGIAVRSHLAPWGDTTKWAVEANMPFWRYVGARFELVHQTVGFARYDDTNPVAATLSRAPGKTGGYLSGTAYYLELYGWVMGDMTMLETPGLETAPRYTRFTDTQRPRWGLMVAAKYEHLGFDVGGIPMHGPDAMGNITADPAAGHYSIDAFELGLNAWATKHARMSANYVMNYIGGDSAQVRNNLYYHHAEHELLFRLGLNL